MSDKIQSDFQESVTKASERHWLAVSLALVLHILYPEGLDMEESEGFVI